MAEPPFLRPVAPSLSPIQAASEAIELVGRRLFPFQLNRWFALGFVAFLDSCGRGGGNAGGRFPAGGGPSTASTDSTSGAGDVITRDVARASDWVSTHLALILVLALGALVLIVAMMALVSWLQSRGTFMYLDDVATGRADVKRPWREHRAAAHSYFVWVFGTSLAFLCAMLLLLVPAGMMGWSLFRHGFSMAPVLGIVGLFFVFLALVVLSVLFGLLLRGFAAPLQLVLGVPCGRALGVAWTLVRGHKGAFLGFVVLKIVYALVAGIAALLAGCFTCCIGFLPVIAHTILQPVLYFERAWSLFLLRQAGYDLFAAMTPPVVPLPLEGMP